MNSSSPFLFSAWPPCVVGAVSNRSNMEEVLLEDPGFNLLEWRVDMLLEEISCDELTAIVAPRLPVLITVRSPKEGGRGDLSTEKRKYLYRALMPLADSIDIEVDCLEEFSDIVHEAKQRNIAVIGSAHNFDAPFSEEHIQEMDVKGRQSGADLIKIAHALHAPADLLIGLDWLSEKRRKKEPVALMGMGKLGTVSRFLHAQLGSHLVYGYIGNTSTAPGQLPADEFTRILSMLLPLSPH